jgi:hypothetical protein
MEMSKTEGGGALQTTGHEAATLALTTSHNWWPSTAPKTFHEARTTVALRDALQADPDALNIGLIRALRELVEALEVKVTMRTAGDYDDALAVLHEFHGWTLGEFQHAFAMIRTGRLGEEQWFERFKAPQLRQCLRQYANERALYQQRHQAKYLPDIYPQTSPHSQPVRSLTAIADLLDLPEYKPKRATLADYGERQQGVPTAAYQAQSEAQGQAADARSGGQEGRPVVLEGGAL